MRKGLGKGLGMGYKNLAPLDPHIHSLSAKGQKTCFFMKPKKLNAIKETRMFKIDDEYSVVAQFDTTSYGFRHLAKLMKNGREVSTAKATYYNRTWESFEYESVIKDLIFGYFDEKEAKEKFQKLVERRHLYAKGVVPLPKEEMAKKVEKFMKTLNKSYGVKGNEGFVVDTDAEPDNRNLKKKNYIQLRTDGLAYEQIFDPSMSEMPYLMRDAVEEFGMDKNKVKIPTGYEDQERFGKLLKDNGWDYEPYGMGIITIYKEE